MTTITEDHTIEAGVDPDWAHRTYLAAKRFLRKRSEFFPDDLTSIMKADLPTDLRHTGAVVRRLKREGLIEETGNFRKVAAGTHYRPVYASALFRAK